MTTDTTALATEAITAEGIPAYFGEAIDHDTAVAALAEAMDRMGVEADPEGWTAPEGLAELAQTIAR